jgi:hypothetical protein
MAKRLAVKDIPFFLEMKKRDPFMKKKATRQMHEQIEMIFSNDRAAAEWITQGMTRLLKLVFPERFSPRRN